MNNTGSLHAVIGADINPYQKAMNTVTKVTQDAMNAAQKATQNGSNNMLRTIQVMLSSIIKSSNSDVQRIISNFSNGFNKASSLVQRSIAGIGEKLPEPFRHGLTNVLDFSRVQFNKLAQLTSKTAWNMGSSLEKFADKLPAPFGKALNTVSSKLKQFGFDSASTFTKIGQSALRTSNQIKSVSVNTIDKIINTFNTQLLRPLLTGIKGIGTAFGNAFKGIGSIINNTLIQPIFRATKAVLNFTKIMANALIVEPFLLMKDAVVAVTKAIGTGLLNVIKKVGSLVNRYMVTPLMKVITVVAQIGLKIGQVIVNNLIKVGQFINRYLLTPMMNVAKIIGNIAVKIGSVLLSAIQSVGNVINRFMIQPLISVGRVLLDITRHFISLGATIVRELMRPIMAVGRAINTYLIQPIINVGRQFAEVGRNLYSQLEAPIRSIGTAFNNAFTMVGQGFIRLPRFAVNAVNQISDRLNPLVQVAGNVSNRMGEAFTRGFNSMNQKASSVLNNISAKFAGSEKGANSFKNSVMQLASAFSLAGLASKALSAITGSFDDAISRFDALNQFPRIMEMWGYSADDAKKASDKMQAGIDGLPTKLDDITMNVQKLTTITGDLDKSTDAAIALNNAFLASGSSSADASRGLEQYSQMLATGAVDLQSWRTLQETMPGALMQTAEAFGYTGQSASVDFYEALKEGDVTFDQFQDKLIELNDGVGGFAEQAKEATVGIKTSLQNLSTAVSRNVEGIIRKFDEVLQSRGLPQIAVMIDNGKDAINDLGQAVQSVVPNIVDGFMSVGTFDLVTILALPKVISLVGTFGSKLGKLAPIADTMAGGIQSAFSSVSGSLAGLGKTIGGFGGLMANSASIGVNALGGMVSAITSLAGVALSAIGPTAILGLIVVGLGIVNKSFGEEINKMLKMVTEKAPEVINNLVKGIQEKLPELLTLGTQLIADLTAVIVNTLPLVINAGMDILNSLLTGISEQFPSLINSALQIVTVLATSILEALPRLVLMGFQIILAFVQGINENIDTIIQSAQTILTGFVNSIIENLPQIIETGISIILGLIQGLTEMLPELLIIGFQSLMTLTQGIMDNIPLLMTGAIMIVQSLVGFLVENLPMILNMGMQFIFTLVDGIFQNLPTIITTGMQIVLTLIGGLVQMLPEIITMGISLVTNLVSGIAENLPMIIASGFQLVLGFVGGIFEMLPDIISAGWDMILALGQGLMEAIPNVLTGAWEGIKSGFGSMWDAVTGKNKEGTDSTKTDFSDLSSSATTSTSQMATNVSQYAGSATDSITNASNLANSAGSKDYSQMATNVSSSLSGMTSTVSSETNAQLSAVQSNLTGASTTSSNEFKSMASIANIELSSMTGMVETETLAQESAIKKGTTASNKQAEQSYKQMAKTAQTTLNDMTKNTESSFKKMQNTINQNMNSILSNIRSKSNTIQTVWGNAMLRVSTVTRTQMNHTRNIVSNMMISIVSIMRSTASQARSAGVNAGAGFRNGLASTRGSIMGTARGIASSVSATIRSALSIHSPSRVLMKLGSYAGEGLDVGLLGWVSKIEKTSMQLAQAMALEDYQVESNLATSASIESSGVSSRLENLSDDVKNVERAEPVFEIHSHWDGEEVYYYVKRKDARKDSNSKYFKN